MLFIDAILQDIQKRRIQRVLTGKGIFPFLLGICSSFGIFYQHLPLFLTTTANPATNIQISTNTASKTYPMEKNSNIYQR